MKIKNLFLYLSFLTTLNVIQTKAEDLSEEYKTQQDCTWEKSDYKFVTNKGEQNRFCIDNKSNIYQIFEKGRRGTFSGIDLSALGPTRLGNLKKPEVTTGNSCVLGTNVQCLSNVVNTTTQYKVEGNYLKKYTRRDMNGSKGKVNSTIVAIHRKGKSELREKAISLNKIAIKSFMEKDYAKTFKYSVNSGFWLPNQVSLYLIAFVQLNDGKNLNQALYFADSLINNTSYEYGLDEIIATRGDYYMLRGLIKATLQMDKNSICKDYKKAIELSPNDDDMKESFTDIECTL